MPLQNKKKTWQRYACRKGNVNVHKSYFSLSIDTVTEEHIHILRRFVKI